MSTYFFVDPFILPYWFYNIRWELVDESSIIIHFPSTFCPTLGHHQGKIYYKSDVAFVCTLLLCKKSVCTYCNSTDTLRAESTWEKNNYGRFINQFPLNIIKSIRQYERINKKIYRPKMSIMFVKYVLILIYIYIYIYIYIKHFIINIKVCTYIYIYIYILKTH